MANGEGYKTGGGGKKQPFGDNGQYVEKETAKENIDRNGIYRQNTKYGSILDKDSKKSINKFHAMSIEQLKERQTIDRNSVENIPYASDFNRLKTAHHMGHAKEMGFKNQKQYETAAIKFWNSGEGDIYYSKKRNRFYKYNTKTLEFVAVSEKGVVYTYMNLSKNTFIRKEKQDGCIKY